MKHNKKGQTHNASQQAVAQASERSPVPKRSPNPNGGRHEPSKETRTIVELCMLTGLTHEQTAAMVPRYSKSQLAATHALHASEARGISVETLKKYYGAELECGRQRLVLLCARNLTRIATLGLAPGTSHDRSTLGAILAILKSRGGKAWLDNPEQSEPTALPNRRIIVELNLGDPEGKREYESTILAKARDSYLGFTDEKDICRHTQPHDGLNTGEGH